MSVAESLLQDIDGKRFSTVLADPPWRFHNKTGKMAPEHKRLSRYPTLSFAEIGNLPVASIVRDVGAPLPLGAECPIAAGFEGDGTMGVRAQDEFSLVQGTQRRWTRQTGVGFYFRNVTEMVLFGVRGKNARTLQRGRSQENIVLSQKRKHSQKPDAQYEIIEACGPGPYLELFARGTREGLAHVR